MCDRRATEQCFRVVACRLNTRMLWSRRSSTNELVQVGLSAPRVRWPNPGAQGTNICHRPRARRLAFAEPSLASTTSPEPKVPGSFFCSAGGRKWPDRKPPPLPPAASVVRGRPAAGASVPIRRSCDGFRMPANADLSTGTRAGVRKPPRNETAGSRAPGGSASAMGNWLAPLSEHGPEDVAPARRSQNWSWAGFGAQLDYGAIVLNWNLCGPILPSPVVASYGPAV